MMVYRAGTEMVEPSYFIQRLGPGRGYEELLRTSIGFGELESGVVDALCPAQDDLDEVSQKLRETGLALGRALYSVCRGRAGEAACPTFDILKRLQLPAKITAPVSEGFAFYAVYPEMYFAAAERALKTTTAPEIVCIGNRNIGTSLGSAVGAVAQAAGRKVHSITVRPRGHPFQRRLALSPALRRWIEERKGCAFLVVDEGPGLSGSSFASVVTCLNELGIPDSDITLFPSWLPAADALNSADARDVWARSNKIAVSFEEVWLNNNALFERFDCRLVADFSGGNWRDFVLPSAAPRPAIQPQHEARKYLCAQKGSDKHFLLKFEGLGHYGEAKHERAKILARAGFTATPVALSAGFLMTDWVEGVPLTAADITAADLDEFAHYLAFVADAFPTNRVTDLGDMISTNIWELLGEHWQGNTDVPHMTEIDGRMLPHEWIRTNRGLLKTDALDHHCDHFFPGAQDIAWDVAATIQEFALDADAANYFVASYSRRSCDRAIGKRLPFYRRAYLAWKAGYCHMFAGAMPPGSDRIRMERAARNYTAELKRLLNSKDRHDPATNSNTSTPTGQMVS